MSFSEFLSKPSQSSENLTLNCYAAGKEVPMPPVHVTEESY